MNYSLVFFHLKEDFGDQYKNENESEMQKMNIHSNFETHNSKMETFIKLTYLHLEWQNIESEQLFDYYHQFHKFYMHDIYSHKKQTHGDGFTVRSASVRWKKLWISKL